MQANNPGRRWLSAPGISCFLVSTLDESKCTESESDGFTLDSTDGKVTRPLCRLVEVGGSTSYRDGRVRRPNELGDCVWIHWCSRGLALSRIRRCFFFVRLFDGEMPMQKVEEEVAWKTPVDRDFRAERTKSGRRAANGRLRTRCVRRRRAPEAN